MKNKMLRMRPQLISALLAHANGEIAKIKNILNIKNLLNFI